MKRTLSFILSIVLVISVFMVSERDVNAKTVIRAVIIIQYTRKKI